MSAWLTSTRTSPKRFPFLAMHASYLADPTQMIGDERHQTGISVCALTVRTMTNFCDGEAAGAAGTHCRQNPSREQKQKQHTATKTRKNPQQRKMNQQNKMKAD